MKHVKSQSDEWAVNANISHSIKNEIYIFNHVVSRVEYSLFHAILSNVTYEKWTIIFVQLTMTIIINYLKVKFYFIGTVNKDN